MRGLVALYAVACEEEGTVSNSQLLQLFRKMDMAEELLLHEKEDASANATAGSSRSHVYDLDSDHMRSWKYMHAAFPTTLVIGSLSNYLGDAGTAAVFRLLPYMKWVRRIEARDVGAGPRAVAALCHVLSLTEKVPVELKQAENYAEDGGAPQAKRFFTVTLPAVPLEHIDLTGNALYAVSARELLRCAQERNTTAQRARRSLAVKAGRVGRVLVPAPPAILLDYDAIPATIARGLKAFNVDATLVARVKAMEQQRRVLAMKQGLFCTATADKDKDNRNLRATPTGESVIYRVPEYFPALPTQKEEGSEDVAMKADPLSKYTEPDNNGTAAATPQPFYDHSNAAAAALASAVNKHMEAYLLAHRCCTARDHLAQAKQTVADTGAEKVEKAQSHAVSNTGSSSAAVAAQLCVDLGPEVLAHLADTQALVWLTLDLEQQQQLGEEEEEEEEQEKREEDPEGEEEESYAAIKAKEEVLFGVGRLLRGFHSNPFLEEELIGFAENSNGAPLALTRHLTRLKELYYRFTSTHPNSASSNKRKAENTNGSEAGLSSRIRWLATLPYDDINELRGLYLRIVSALVTGPFCDAKLPSLMAAEQRIREVRALLMDFMLDGEDTPLSDAARQQQTALPIEAKRSLPLLCSAAKYFKVNHKSVSEEWNAHYLGLAREHQTEKTQEKTEDKPADGDGILEEVLDFYLRPFSVCTCASSQQAPDTTASDGNTGQGALPILRPCAACSHAALTVMYGFLNNPYACERAALLAPFRDYLPHDVKRFLCDIALQQQQSQRHGQRREDGSALLKDVSAPAAWRGSGYVPALFGTPSSLEAFTTFQETMQENPKTLHTAQTDDARAQALPPYVSVLDIFAQVDGQRQRLEQLCSAFAEWYRLQAIETFDCTQP